MEHKKGRHPGAVWRKTDLQIHTPRDPNWSGSPSLPGGAAEAEAARDKWADTFVAECLKRGLGAIAITDHHDVVMYDYVRRAIDRSHAAKTSLWLFPGMEVTCDDSVQCLILFDQNTDQAILERLFGGHLLKIMRPDAQLECAPQAALCGKNIAEFLGSLYEDVAFKGVSIVLPHASKGGHKDILRKGFHPRFAELTVDGVYNETAYADLDAVTLKKIYGEIKDWGDRRRGIITTGDNRVASFDHLAVNPCWIRLGEPTSESIRQAVLADEARITYQQPDIPAQRILELRVASSLTGTEFELVFNDGFNALIGGRGSGKSAVLEYLRFGLGRSTVDTADDRSQDRERGLIENTLPGGSVEVVLERDGVKETWRRTSANQAFISIEEEGKEAIDVPIATAQERFRARAFYQKQLSTLVRKRDTADEQITGIAAAELVDRRRQGDRDIEEAGRGVQVAFQRVVQGWTADAAYERAKLAATDLRRRLAATRERLEGEGLSPEQQAVLDEAPQYARTENQFALTARQLTAEIKQIDEFKSLDLSGWKTALQVPEVEEVSGKLSEANVEISRLRGEIRKALIIAQTATSEGFEKFKQRHAAFRVRHEAANKAQAHLGTLLADHKRLNDDLELAERHERETEDERQKFADARKKLTEARESLASRLTNMKSILSEAATQVEVMSQGVLRASVEEETKPARYIEALVELCERCGIRDLEDKCTHRVEQATVDGHNEWEKLVNGLLDLRQTRIRTGDTGEIDPNAAASLRAILNWELTDNQAKLVLQRLDDARLARLLSARPEAFIRFEYKDRGVYMPFERASPGQQASALLTLLLNQEAGTLIIDQPEDDLDNRVIMTIVKLLQTTKRKRQLIFATHNPNFVVNGDADKVIALTPSVEPSATASVQAAQIEIEVDGAIETPPVRTAITDTMEGGQAAFELRGRKYAFES